MRVRRPTLALLALLAGAIGVGVGACGRTGAGFPGGGPTATATLPGPQDFGDGHDGNLASNSAVPSDCHVLTLGSASKVTVMGAWGALKVGDRVLLLQAQDGVILASGTGGVGTTLASSAIGDAGRWEIIEVASIAGGTFTAVAPLARHYSTTAPAGRHAEACRVPQFANAVVDHVQQIRATAWDGNIGGVTAFYVATSLTLSALGAIDVSGDGFRGGRGSQKDVGNDDVTLEDFASAGGKGEGIDSRGYNTPGSGFGRGNYGNGAGGGNPRSAGGGGGGNGGAGGAGGMQNEGSLPDPETRGRGGQAIAAPLGERLLFGGGGGGGQQGADGGNPGDGGRGGGVLVLFARRVTGVGSVVASGTQGIAGSADGHGNGGGGGGAGGTVLVSASSGAITGIYAQGGIGGDAQENGEKNGPGGGGAGGRISVYGPAGTLDVSGGTPGVSQVSGSPTWGATTGGIGVAN